MGLQYAAFTREHVLDAAELFAARHRANRLREPDLPPAYEASAACADEISGLLDRPGASGVVELRDGRVVGYLLGVPQLPAPNGGHPLFFQRRSISVFGVAYAAALDEGVESYRRLYAEAAPGWLAQGYFVHYIGTPVCDVAAREAWESLGFGRDLTGTVRETRLEVETGGRAPEVEIRRAGPDDVEDVYCLMSANLRYHAGSPVFFPLFAEAWPSLHDFATQELADPASVAWLVYRNGRAIAIQTFAPAHPSVQTPEGAVYLDHGYTEPEARGTGVATALLAHSMRWARDAGHTRCTLTFAPANLLSTRFWLGHGFRPLHYRMVRRLDEQIAWANG